jgi:hypothetical protein
VVGRWRSHRETALYDSPWVSLRLADVERPSGRRHSHHLLRMPQAGAGAVVVDRAGAVLLVHRHRFIPETFGWELPSGRIDHGEAPRLRWWPRVELPSLLRSGDVTDACTTTGLLWHLQLG